MERIFDIWPSLKEMAAEMGAKYQTVASWKRRGAIPAAYDTLIVLLAKRRGVEVSFADLAATRARPIGDVDARNEQTLSKAGESS